MMNDCSLCKIALNVICQPHYDSLGRLYIHVHEYSVKVGGADFYYPILFCPYTFHSVDYMSILVKHCNFRYDDYFEFFDRYY